MITIVDYGLGNIRAFLNVYKRLNIDAATATTSDQLRGASKVILPGVGSYDHAMERLTQSGMRDTLDDLALRRRVPILGVCVGMQILARGSAEGALSGLGWIDGQVKRLEPPAPGVPLPVPHMGWNDVRRHGPACKLLDGMAEGAYFYFVHTYQAPDGPWVRGVTEHGGPVVAVVEHQNFVGVQFHPERSGPAGAAMLERFFSL